MISLRNETHISLLFVDGQYHRLGIGRGLVEYVSSYVLTEEGHDSITVDAALYATGFYHRLGFVDTDRQQTRTESAIRRWRAGFLRKYSKN